MIWPSELADPSQIMQKLRERTANFILRNLRRNPDSPWCLKMLARFELPATVHHHAHAPADELLSDAVVGNGLANHVAKVNKARRSVGYLEAF